MYIKFIVQLHIIFLFSSFSIMNTFIEVDLATLCTVRSYFLKKPIYRKIYFKIPSLSLCSAEALGFMLCIFFRIIDNEHNRHQQQLTPLHSGWTCVGERYRKQRRGHGHYFRPSRSRGGPWRGDSPWTKQDKLVSLVMAYLTLSSATLVCHYIQKDMEIRNVWTIIAIIVIFSPVAFIIFHKCSKEK